MKKVEIKLTKKEIQKAQSFAEERTKDNTLYQRRGGFKVSDIVNGALGEIAAYKYLKSCNEVVSKPDFTIHSKKSYNADLISDKGKHFHVKSQGLDSVEKYGESWLLQRSDPILNCITKKHYLIPSVVDIDNKIVTLYGVMCLESVKQNLGECKLKWFQKTKVAIYMDKLRKLSYSARWRVR